MKKLWLSALLAAAAFSGTAFAHDGWDRGYAYGHHERHWAGHHPHARQQIVVYQAPVVYRERVEYREAPVYYEQAPRRYYERTSYSRGNGDQLLGQAIGAVAGGLIGSNVGQGNGRIAATAVGAVIGGMVGGNMAGYR